MGQNTGFAAMLFGKRRTKGYAGVERRRAVRVRTDLSAQILLLDYRSVSCLVTDYSPLRGATVRPVSFRIARCLPPARWRHRSARTGRAQRRRSCRRSIHRHGLVVAVSPSGCGSPTTSLYRISSLPLRSGLSETTVSRGKDVLMAAPPQGSNEAVRPSHQICVCPLND